MIRPAIALLAALTLAACVGGGGKPSKRTLALIDRALATAPGEAQPSTIVATEVAFARAAREEGQWTAFRQFAASGAILHAGKGPIAAEAWLATQSDPEIPVQWSPRTVVMSCNGALAVSAGRLRNSQGLVGTFVTTWVRQSDNSYKWSYDVAGLDDPQPPPRKRIEEGEIIVTAIDAVQGLIADCPQAGSPVPPPPALSLASDNPGQAQLSGDGTLRWRWEHRPDGTKYVAVDYWYEGEWVQALEEELASPPEQ